MLPLFAERIHALNMAHNPKASKGYDQQVNRNATCGELISQR